MIHSTTSSFLPNWLVFKCWYVLLPLSYYYYQPGASSLNSSYYTPPYIRPTALQAKPNSRFSYYILPEVLLILVRPILCHRPSLCTPLLSPLQFLVSETSSQSISVTFIPYRTYVRNPMITLPIKYPTSWV